jgi:hypothetical protein
MAKFRLIRQKLLISGWLPGLYMILRFGAFGDKLGWFMCSHFTQIGMTAVFVAGYGFLAFTAVIDAQRVAWPALLDGRFFVPPKEYEPFFPKVRGLRYMVIGALIVLELEIVSRIGCWLSHHFGLS